MTRPANLDSVMAEMMALFRERRSHRDYLADPVAPETLRTILEAARWAPSGENAQPWRFIVVTDEKKRATLGRISRRGSGRRFTGEFLTQSMHDRFQNLQDPEKRLRVFRKLTTGEVSAFVANAPVLIIVAGYKPVWDMPFDCSAAIQNMLLAATALDVGSCWVNASSLDIRDETEIKELLRIPGDYKMMAIVAFGHPSRVIKPRPRKQLAELVFDEVFGRPYFTEGGETHE